jgi:hypothetical protein
MATAVSWPVGTVLIFLQCGALACSALGSRRRSRFHIRLGCANLVMLALAFGLGLAINFSAMPQRAFGVAWVTLLLAALAVAPVFCYHAFAFSRDSLDEEGGAGGGGGFGPPPPPPPPPRGGTPLPDAEQARARKRDHNRPRLRATGPRRRAVEPARRRAPAAPGRR